MIVMRMSLLEPALRFNTRRARKPNQVLETYRPSVARERTVRARMGGMHAKGQLRQRARKRRMADVVRHPRREM